MIEDCLLIFIASFVSAVLAEGLSWLLVYRTESYQNIREKINRLQTQLARKKDVQTTPSKIKSKNKKIDRYEEALKTANRELTLSKMKMMFAVGFTLFSLFGILNSHFGGRVIAKLPFEPLPLIRNISHRGLPGDDLTDCSMAFLYALCSISIRANLQKALGFTPPKSASTGFFGAS